MKSIKNYKFVVIVLIAILVSYNISSISYADYLKSINGIAYRYSTSGDKMSKYTGWAKTSKGKYYYKDGVKVKKNTTINGVRYKFDRTGLCTGKFTGWTKSTSGRRYWKNGVILKNAWLKSGGYYYYAGIDGYLIVEKVPEKFPKMKSISDSLKKSLCEQYIARMRLQKKYTADDIEIELYLGNYNGNDVAVIMPKGGLSEIELTNLGTIECGNYNITVPNGFEPLVSINNALDFLDLSYLNGYITDDDIIKINYYVNIFLASKGVDPTISEKTYPALTPLSDEQKQIIINDFLKYKKNDRMWNNVSAENLYVKSYYGTYNGNEVVIVWCNDMDCTDDIQEINIAGFKMELGSGSYELLLHKNGSFVALEEAYNKGCLSKADIEKICYYSQN